MPIALCAADPCPQSGDAPPSPSLVCPDRFLKANGNEQQKLERKSSKARLMSLFSSPFSSSAVEGAAVMSPTLPRPRFWGASLHLLGTQNLGKAEYLGTCVLAHSSPP